jgi:hypothetical protein
METSMNDTIEKLKGQPFNLEKNVDYADGSVVSQTLLKKQPATSPCLHLMPDKV